MTMGNVEELMDADERTDRTPMGGSIGTATTLPMSDEEKERSEKERRPIGFVWGLA